MAAAPDPAKQQLFDGLVSPAPNSKPLSDMSAPELKQVTRTDLGGVVAKKLHSTGLQAGEKGWDSPREVPCPSPSAFAGGQHLHACSCGS